MPRRNNAPKQQRTPFQAGECSSKQRFANQVAAQRQAEILMLQQPGLELSVYHCHRCNGWHLTSRQIGESE